MHILNGLWELIKFAGLDIALVAGSAVGLWFVIRSAIKSKDFSKVITIAKTALAYAERLYGSKTGELKKAQAITYLNEHSWIIRTFLTENDIDLLVEKAFGIVYNVLGNIEQKSTDLYIQVSSE